MIQKMHHVAYKCRNAEETRAFYEDLLGLPLAHVIQLSHVPSTGEFNPYVHVFFELHDGSFLAFFDIGDGKVSELDADTPAWLPHFAMAVPTMDELRSYRDRLDQAGVSVTGPVDHGFVQSIYFRDPNNLRMEITTPVEGPEKLAGYRAEARQKLDAFTASMAPQEPAR